MTQTIRRLPSVTLFLFALIGCDVFDESLLENPDAGPPEGQPELLVGDSVSAGLPVNPSYRTDYHDPLDFNGYTDNLGRLPSCLDGAPAPGADIFFKVDMVAGQKWHFHILSAEATPAADPAVYVLNAPIDPNQACTNPLSGINACGAGFPEHFSFNADATQPYYVGVDEVSGVNENLKIFAVLAECGNGFREHSEYCDPTATGAAPVPDCENCRKVLENGQEDGDLSFNDGPLDATVLKLPDSSEFGFTVNGQVNTDCDFDFFTFDLAESMSVTATLDGLCEGIDLQFWNDDGETSPFTFGDPRQDCMPKPASLRSGRHWIRVAGRPGVTTKPRYKIELAFEAN